MIRIKSRNAGFRRCGIAHPAEWTEYPDDRFDKQQLARLKAEPMLRVEVVAYAPEPEPDTQVAAPVAKRKTSKSAPEPAAKG